MGKRIKKSEPSNSIETNDYLRFWFLFNGPYTCNLTAPHVDSVSTDPKVDVCMNLLVFCSNNSYRSVISCQ